MADTYGRAAQAIPLSLGREGASLRITREKRISSREFISLASPHLLS